MQDSLEGVEHRFRDTAHKAVRIGDRLSKMEGQRARAAEAMELLEFFKVCVCRWVWRSDGPVRYHVWSTALYMVRIVFDQNIEGCGTRGHGSPKSASPGACFCLQASSIIRGRAVFSASATAVLRSLSEVWGGLRRALLCCGLSPSCPFFPPPSLSHHTSYYTSPSSPACTKHMFSVGILPRTTGFRGPPRRILRRPGHCRAVYEAAAARVQRRGQKSRSRRGVVFCFYES